MMYVYTPVSGAPEFHRGPTFTSYAEAEKWAESHNKLVTYTVQAIVVWASQDERDLTHGVGDYATKEV